MADYYQQLYEPEYCLTIRQSGVYYLVHILPLSRRGHCTAGACNCQGIIAPWQVDKKRAPERLLLLLRGMFTEYTRTRSYLFVAPTCAAA